MGAVILLSGGMDSAVNLAVGVRHTSVKLALTADYGQLAAARELQAAKTLAAHYGVPHQTVRLPFLQRQGGGALLGEGMIPEPALATLDNPQRANATALGVWVPNRNGLLINLAAYYAESMGCTQIICGFNREEAATFPDNSAQFVEAINVALRFSTRNAVQVISFTQRLDKKEIVALGDALQVPWPLIWSCYRGGDQPCGRCESCLRWARAMSALGRPEPHNREDD